MCLEGIDTRPLVSQSRKRRKDLNMDDASNGAASQSIVGRIVRRDSTGA